MKSPIIVIEEGVPTVYSTANRAEKEIEPTDAMNGDYIPYDSAGCLLQWDAKKTTSLWTSYWEVKLSECSCDPIYKLRLKLHIVSFFLYHHYENLADDSIFHLSLQELIEKLAEARGVVE